MWHHLCFILSIYSVAYTTRFHGSHPVKRKFVVAEDLVWMCRGLGIETGVDLDALVATSAWVAQQLGRPSPSRVVRALAG